jgi:pimeloyl-ACP methyl ester carboxylesterase
MRGCFRRRGHENRLMGTTRNGPVVLSYDVDGRGADLLLIAGSASTRAIWALARPHLAQRFRTIAFDNRDSGESTIVRDPYSIKDLAEDALAVLDAAGSERAHVIGHSLGGVVAQELAFAHAHRFESLTLVSTWARSDVYANNVMELLGSLTESVRDDRTLLAAILYIGAGETTLRSNALFDMVDAAMALGPLAPRPALLRQWNLDSGVDTVARLPELSLPVHAIWGSEDRLLPPWHSRQLIEAIPQARGTAIEGSGHNPMIVAPELFAQSVAAFIDTT